METAVLDVRAVEIPRWAKLCNVPVEADKVFVKGLTPKVTQDSLLLYLEDLKMYVNEMTYCTIPGVAMITFTKVLGMYILCSTMTAHLVEMLINNLLIFYNYKYNYIYG